MTSFQDLYKLLYSQLVDNRGYDPGLFDMTTIPQYDNLGITNIYGYINDLKSPLKYTSFDVPLSSPQNINDYQKLSSLANKLLNYRLK